MTRSASAFSAATWTTGCRSSPSRSDPGPLGCRHDAPGVQVHQRLMCRRSTGPGVRVKTIERGWRRDGALRSGWPPSRGAAGSTGSRRVQGQPRQGLGRGGVGVVGEHLARRLDGHVLLRPQVDGHRLAVEVVQEQQRALVRVEPVRQHRRRRRPVEDGDRAGPDLRALLEDADHSANQRSRESGPAARRRTLALSYPNPPSATRGANRSPGRPVRTRRWARRSHCIGVRIASATVLRHEPRPSRSPRRTGSPGCRAARTAGRTRAASGAGRHAIMVASRRRIPRSNNRMLGSGRELREHVVALLRGQPAQVEFVVVSQERRPLRPVASGGSCFRPSSSGSAGAGPARARSAGRSAKANIICARSFWPPRAEAV